MDNQKPTVREHCIQQGFSDRVIEEGVPYLVDGWEHFAVAVSDYRHFYRENYLNDLMVRTSLLPLASEAELTEVRTRLETADAKFIANSVDAPACVCNPKAAIKYGYTRQQNWWYYRMPKIVDPDF